jgi:hypothetical protein
MENLKRKKDKIFLTFRSGDLNPRYSIIFPPMIWIFMWSEEPEIKSKQVSKRDRTLLEFKLQNSDQKSWKTKKTEKNFSAFDLVFLNFSR